MASAAPKRRWTGEEYLAYERRAEGKHEFLDGEVFAMAGVSRRHALIAMNLARALANRLEGKPCEVYASDIRTLVDRTGLYTYPDVIVVCGAPEFLDNEVDTLLNPTVLVEVLSPSTEAYDRGKKFAHYRQLPSLQHYLLIAQDEFAVDCYTRRGEKWELESSNQPDHQVRLESIACSVTLAEIYARVTFPDSKAPEGEPR